MNIIKKQNIFIYLGFGSEIDTMSYIQEFINEGKHIFIPRTDIKTKKDGKLLKLLH